MLAARWRAVARSNCRVAGAAPRALRYRFHLGPTSKVEARG